MTVETASGKIVARAAIVTVSSNVLASGNIKFAPELPKRSLDAAAKLSLGSYDRIAPETSGQPARAVARRRHHRAEQFDQGPRCSTATSPAPRCARSTSRLVRPRAVGAGREGDDCVRGGMADRALWQRGPSIHQEDQRDALECIALHPRCDVGRGARRTVLPPDPDRADRSRCISRAKPPTKTLWGTVDGAWDSGERRRRRAAPDRRGGKESGAGARQRLPLKHKRRAAASIGRADELSVAAEIWYTAGCGGIEVLAFKMSNSLFDCHRPRYLPGDPVFQRRSCLSRGAAAYPSPGREPGDDRLYCGGTALPFSRYGHRAPGGFSSVGRLPHDPALKFVLCPGRVVRR